MSRFSGIFLFGLCTVRILCHGCISPVENRNVPITNPAIPVPATRISVSPSLMVATPATILSHGIQFFFRQMDRIAASEPITLFGFNSNGSIDFNDIQVLFRRI
jgi:hypothetical protein